MKKSEILQFVSINNDENLSFYLSTILDKLKGFSKENNRIGVFMIVLILLNYLIENSIAESLNIGPISINNLSKIKIFIPLCLSYFIFRYIVIHFHKLELVFASRIIIEEKINIDNCNISSKYFDHFNRLITPFSLYGELENIAKKEVSVIGCLSAFFSVPLSFGVSFLPYYYEYIMLKDLFLNFSNFNFYEKLVYVTTILIIVYSCLYVLQTLRFIVKNKEL